MPIETQCAKQSANFKDSSHNIAVPLDMIIFILKNLNVEKKTKIIRGRMLG